MKPRKWQRILKTEKFALHKAVGEQWTFSVRWRKTETKYGRRVFQAPSVEEAVTLAPVVSGYETTIQTTLLSLDKAFEQARDAAKRGDKAKKDWNYWSLRFVRWLVDHHSDVGNWNQLSRAIVREYLDSYTTQSENTKRLALQPIQQTDAYLAREHGFPRIAENLSLSAQTQRTPANVHLLDILDVLDRIPADDIEITAGVALQGLAGLRLQEAWRLTWDKVDLKQGLIEISKSEQGDVKTPWSHRVIPVSTRVLNALKALDKHHRAQKIQPVTNRLLARFDTWQGYSRTLEDTLTVLKPSWDIRRSELRNALPTWSNAQGVHNEIWEQYLGHAPANVTARHYVPRLSSTTLGDREALKKQMAPFKALVIVPLNKEIKRLLAKLQKERQKQKVKFEPFCTRKIQNA